MNAPSDDDVGTLVESARGEALMERGRRKLVVSREPIFWIEIIYQIFLKDVIFT